MLVVLLLAGCQGHKQQAQPVVSADFKEYAVASRNAVIKKFNGNAFSGKKCTIRVTQNPGSQPSSLVAEGGNPELCSAAINAIKSTIDDKSFPSKPMGLPESIPMDFNP